MSPDEIKALVRSIPDFPKPGIVFRDVTTLISHGEGFAASVEWLAARVMAHRSDVIVGIEARGFIFGAAVAASLRLPFVPVRKPGKLPVPSLAIDYALEYGTDTLEIDPGAIARGQRVVLIDDLLATGGTAEAAMRLIRQCGGSVEQALFVIDLPDLGGSRRLQDNGVDCEALLAFEGH
ncbi:MAG: adenine phosphoribosyltransferase [Novosphingobium sp.]|nr:adenine phosphoribosyltransferase [Novosphingobium sp.]